MTGVFDSGSGGLNALRELRRLKPYEDIVFLADRENAPYGTKTDKELTELTARGIKRLRDYGADRVLIACCTASTVYGRLPTEARDISYPIIEPIAKEAARLTENGKIGVLATKHTVSSHAFRDALSGFEVIEVEAQKLVGAVERGERDGRASGETLDYLDGALSPMYDYGIDTLILGCTHFPSLEGEIRKKLKKNGIYKTVNSAKIGAMSIAKSLGGKIERGLTVFL